MTDPHTTMIQTLEALLSQWLALKQRSDRLGRDPQLDSNIVRLQALIESLKNDRKPQ